LISYLGLRDLLGVGFNVEETPNEFQKEKIGISLKLIIRALLDPEGSLRF